VAEILGAFSTGNSHGAPSLRGFQLKLLQELMAFQLLAPEQHVNQKHLLYCFLASDLAIIGAEVVLQMHVNKVFERLVCGFPPLCGSC